MKNFFKSFLVVVLLAVLPTPALGATAVSSHENAHKYVLDNGMVVLINEMPSSMIVSVDALVKVGSATEGKYLGCGISHFVEHMLFKGTDRRGVGEISKEVRAEGGNINATTGFDRTIYTVELPKGKFDATLDIISDMLMNSKFDPEEVSKEREVILGEMRLYYDRPERQLSQLVFENAYLRHPYRHPIIGYEPLFKSITREDLWDFYSTQYIPNNMILSIAGPVNAQEIIPKVEEVFKDFAAKPYVERHLPREPEQISMRRAEKEYKTDLTRVSMAYQGVAILDRDMYALDVLSMLLGNGESSRLYKEIFKKQGLVETIDVSNYTPMDPGIFEVSFVVDENDKVDPVIAEVKKQLALIQSRGVTAKELEKARRQVLSGYIFSQQTSPSVGASMVIDEFSVGDYSFSEKYVDAIKNVSDNDIRRVAQKYFSDRALTISILKPKMEKSPEENRSSGAEEVQTQKFVLENGITVLLREDHTFPLVTIDLVLNGGTKQETEINNGIFQLLAMSWVKGTAKRSAQVIADDIESRGGSLGGFSGRQSFGLIMELLSEDLGFGLDLLGELVKTPAFDAKEIAKEKQKIEASLIAQQDSISRRTSKALHETLFLTHSLRMEPEGTLESLKNIDRPQIQEYYKKFVVPNNMVISVFGDISAHEVLASLKKMLSGLKPQEVVLGEDREGAPEAMREKVLYMDKQQAMLMVGFQAPGMKDSDRYGMEVLTSVLGAPMSGRLFVEIRDKMGKAYTLGGGFQPVADLGMVTFYVLTTGQDVDQVKDFLFEQIEKVRNNEVGDKEFDDTKQYLKSGHAMSMETNSSKSFISALDELYGLGYDYNKQYDSLVDAVTKEDLKRLAQKYLDPQKSAVVITRPENGVAPSQEEAPVRRESPGSPGSHEDFVE